MLDLGDEAKEFALLRGGERTADHVTFAGVQRWKELVEDRLRAVGDVHEDLATVVGVPHPSDETPLLEGVEHRGHRARRDQDTVRDH